MKRWNMDQIGSDGYGRNRVKEQDQNRIDETQTASLGSTGFSGSQAPIRVRIAPWGDVESTQGSFVVDEEGTRLAVEAFARHGADLPIDYEHQTLGGEFASPSGQAPAAGWIKKLEVDPGVGLFAVVEWTKPALTQLSAKQYRYLSPVALIRKSDRKLVGLHSAALTNKPAIVGMTPIVNRERVIDHVDSDQDALRTLKEVLALPPDCDVPTVLIAASRRFDELDRDRSVREAQDRVRLAIRSGHLTEAQQDFATQLALRDTKLFDEWLRTAPVVVTRGRTMPPVINGSSSATHTLAAKARLEFRSHPELAQLTDEQAYVSDALRVASGN